MDRTAAATPEPGTSATWELPGRAADHATTWAQLGRWTRARIGARDMVYDDTDGWISFRVGPGRPHRKIIIKLCADDTYAVEIGTLRAGPPPMPGLRGLPLYHAGELLTGIYADVLAEIVEEMFGRAVNG